MMNYFANTILPKLQSAFIPVMLIAMAVFSLLYWLGINEAITIYLFWAYIAILFFGSLWGVVREVNKIANAYAKTVLDNFIDP